MPRRSRRLHDPEAQAALDEADAGEGALKAEFCEREQREPWQSSAFKRTQRAFKAWADLDSTLRPGETRRIVDAEWHGFPKKPEWRKLYIDRLMNLGKVLHDDGWQERVDSVKPDNGPGRYAKLMLQKAMNGDRNGVLTLMREGSKLLLFPKEVTRFLRQGLMYKVLNIQEPVTPAKVPPPGNADGVFHTLRRAFPRARELERDYYFHGLRCNGLRPAQIRNRCRTDHPEFKLPSDDNAAREVVEQALKTMASRLRKLQQSGPSA